MRVLHIDTGRSVRGGQRQVELLVDRLGELGVEQTLLAQAPNLAERAIGAPSAFNIWRHARNVDLIHAHDARAHTLAAIFAPDRPLVVARRVAFPVSTGRLSRWKYARARLYLAVSELVGHELHAAGVDWGRIRLIPDGVVVPDDPPPPPGTIPPTVLALDLDDPGKGRELAREACRLAELPLRLTRNLEAALPAADIFLYLSTEEGLGSAVLLAGAWLRPVVASRVGGIPEAVQDGKTGLLVENHAETIANALRSLAADPERSRRLGQAARARVAAHFRDTVMADRTLAAYREIVPAPTGRHAP